jgi:predicted transposase YdaD
MAVLRESPWYQEILEEGIKQGVEQGLLRGRREDILNILRVRFGLTKAIESDLAKQLAKIESNPVLQELLVSAAQVENLAMFDKVLNQKMREIDPEKAP